MQKPKTFETARLLLRMPTMADAEAIFTSYAQDPEVTRYLVWSPHQNMSETREFLANCILSWETKQRGPHVIANKTDGQLLGMVDLRVDGYKADLGYVLAKPFWGNGYVTEAVQVLVDWALTQPTIYRVWAVCDVENTSSARVLEKVGLQREGILRRWLIRPSVGNQPCDCYCYSLVK